MASTYRPVSAKTNENLDETILELYRSNSALLRNGTMIKKLNYLKYLFNINIFNWQK